jgi:TIR domain-containing protein
MDYRVFISYRRQEPTLAHWLHEKLGGELDLKRVFLDTKGVEAGTLFPERLSHAIATAPAFVALIGREWNPVVDGRRRLDDPEDFVRKEIELALDHFESTPHRLVLPVLAEGVAMPSVAELPECLHRLRKIQAVELPRGDYGTAVRGIVERVVTHLDSLDDTPDAETWIIRQVAHEISSLAPSRIVQIGQELKRTFAEITAAPESARALAHAAYRLGPVAFQFLLALEKPPHQMESILDLLATNWISAEEADKVRRNFGDALQGRRVAIECKYADFTPKETLLKASKSIRGWKCLTVKPSEWPDEIIQQIHDELVRRLEKSLRVETTAADEPEPASDEERTAKERELILKKLENRRAEGGGERLPFVLRASRHMGRHKRLLDIVQEAFPPLHILIITDDAEVLEKNIGVLSDIVIPTTDQEVEDTARQAWADAFENVVG